MKIIDIQLLQRVRVFGFVEEITEGNIVYLTIWGYSAGSRIYSKIEPHNTSKIVVVIKLLTL